jgi:aminoglycoside 6'-N-acetyltransferase I
VSCRVRPVGSADAAAWLRMRNALWPEHENSWHAGEIEQFLAGKLTMPLAVLMAVDDEDQPIGFVELFIRSYADGCETDRVAYLEGWYVEPGARRQGVGRALIAASEAWGRAQGCTEFGSDAVLDNQVSAAAHAALGFIEVVRIRCFKKNL